MSCQIVYESGAFANVLPIFATEAFLQTRSSRYGWFYNGEFVLPFYIDQRAIFSKIVFTTESIVLQKGGSEDTFLEAVCEKAKELKVDLIAQPMANALFQTHPKEAKAIEWGSYVVNLLQSEEELLKKMHPKHRNVIKKAQKEGIVIEEADCEMVYQNIKETMLRQNRAYPSRKELQQIKPFSKFHVAKKEGVVQGCAVLPFNSWGAFYLYGGSVARPFTGSLNLLHFEAMLSLKREGVRSYDFMGARPHVKKGSKLEGIQRFKSRFGGELQRGYLWKYSLRSWKVVMIETIQKLRANLRGEHYLGDAIDQESGR